MLQIFYQVLTLWFVIVIVHGLTRAGVKPLIIEKIVEKRVPVATGQLRTIDRTAKVQTFQDEYILDRRALEMVRDYPDEIKHFQRQSFDRISDEIPGYLMATTIRDHHDEIIVKNKLQLLPPFEEDTRMDYHAERAKRMLPPHALAILLQCQNHMV